MMETISPLAFKALVASGGLVLPITKQLPYLRGNSAKYYMRYLKAS